MSAQLLSNFFKVGKLNKAGHYMVADIIPISNEYFFGDKNKIIAVGEHNNKNVVVYKNNELTKFLLYSGISDEELLQYVILEQNKA
jgi:hypothetical protein